MYICIYIHVAFQESYSKSVDKRQKISYILILILILLNNFYKYATIGMFFNLLSIINFKFRNVF